MNFFNHRRLYDLLFANDVFRIRPALLHVEPGLPVRCGRRWLQPMTEMSHAGSHVRIGTFPN